MTRPSACTWYNESVRARVHILKAPQGIQENVGPSVQRVTSQMQEESRISCYLRDSPSPNILAAAICRPRELPGNPLAGPSDVLARGFIDFALTLPPPVGIVGFMVERLELVDIGVAGEETREGDGDGPGAAELSLRPDGTAGTDVYVTVESVYSWLIFCFLVFLGGASSGETG